MSQNTEQNVRTREEIETELQRLFTHGVRGPNAAWQVVHRIFDEVRAYGAAEQRRKDAATSDEALEEMTVERDNAEEFIRKFAERVLGHSVEWSSSYGFGAAFVDVADRVDALEAEIADLKKALRHVTWTASEYGLGKIGHESAVNRARAALTREEGV